eukprot:scaffold9371_cov211-Amphora_coffeaeformis.AAC.6
MRTCSDVGSRRETTTSDTTPLVLLLGRHEIVMSRNEKRKRSAQTKDHGAVPTKVYMHGLYEKQKRKDACMRAFVCYLSAVFVRVLLKCVFVVATVQQCTDRMFVWICTRHKPPSHDVTVHTRFHSILLDGQGMPSVRRGNNALSVVGGNVLPSRFMTTETWQPVGTNVVDLNEVCQ